MLTTLRSATSGRVVKGELLDCVPVFLDEHLSRESRKLSVMMQRELVSYSGGPKSLEIFSASCEESVLPIRHV